MCVACNYLSLIRSKACIFGCEVVSFHMTDIYIMTATHIRAEMTNLKHDNRIASNNLYSTEHFDQQVSSLDQQARLACAYHHA